MARDAHKVERTVTRMEPSMAPASDRTLREEILVVLALSLLASAVYAVLSLLSAPVKGVRVASVNQDTELARQLAWSPFAAVGASAVLRGAYHLYQGWGGFGGNLAMGILFGVAYLRLRRTWPFAIAHFLLDVAAGIGFILFRHHLPGFS